MEERGIRSAKDSFTTQVQVLTQRNLNGYNRLFGGQLMEWMDIVAAVTARRHAARNVTTARVSELDFKAPAHANDTLVLTGEVTHVGRTSMEIQVCVYVEELGGEQRLINQAKFVMVALDDEERPTPVPLLKEEVERG